MMTAGDHVRELIDAYDGLEAHTASGFLWQAAILVYQEHPWVFCLRESRIVTEDAYSDGTIQLTKGSQSVVLTGGTWDPTWIKRRIVAGGFAEPYDITILSATTGTLSNAWVRDDNAAATYTTFREQYPLPSDCNFGCEYILLDINRSRMMRMKDFGVFAKGRTRAGLNGVIGTPGFTDAMIGSPGWVTRTALDISGVGQLTFGPQAPSVAEVYPLYYFAAPVKPTDLAGVITPLFPSQYEDLLWRRALWLYAERKRKWRDRDQHRAAYYDRFFDAVKDLDGGAEVERVIRGTYPDMVFDYRADMLTSAIGGRYVS